MEGQTNGWTDGRMRRKTSMRVANPRTNNGELVTTKLLGPRFHEITDIVVVFNTICPIVNIVDFLLQTRNSLTWTTLHYNPKII